MHFDSTSSSGDGKRRIYLDSLAEGMPAVTPAFGASCAEAGSVCLETQGHSCGVKLTIGGSYTETYELHWTTVNDQAKKCWNDAQVATEHGAYGIAFLLVRRLTSFTVIERARKGPGFDYWLGEHCDKSNEIFEKKARLEVSGIQNGSEGDVNYRVKQKLEQTNPSDRMGLPAYIVVVEFNRPTSRVVAK